MNLSFTLNFSSFPCKWISLLRVIKYHIFWTRIPLDSQFWANYSKIWSCIRKSVKKEELMAPDAVILKKELSLSSLTETPTMKKPMRFFRTVSKETLKPSNKRILMRLNCVCSNNTILLWLLKIEVCINFWALLLGNRSNYSEKICSIPLLKTWSRLITPIWKEKIAARSFLEGKRLNLCSRRKDGLWKNLFIDVIFEYKFVK